MFDGNGRIGLAFGLVVGFVIAVLFLIVRSGDLTDWFHHDGVLITSKDTLAQWIMTFFSIIAAALLWRTLRATQEMAKDTRRIGEAQVRTYLDVKLTQVTAGEIGKSLWLFKVSVNNRGQSPASQVYVHVKVDEWESFETVFPDLGAGDDFEGGMQVIGLPDDAFIRPKGGKWKPLGVCITVRFLDVFSENYRERVDRRDFSIDREGGGSEAIRIRFMGDNAAIFKRMEQAKIFR